MSPRSYTRCTRVTSSRSSVWRHGVHAAGPVAAAVLSADVTWAPDAEKELGKIPFFVRGKARRNTETYAREHGVHVITVEALYDAKAHYSR